jgi:pentatricopeptide repeat protein
MAYNMVIDGLCKEMELEKAEKVLEHGSAPDQYGIVIHSYCKMGNLEKAWHHVEAIPWHRGKLSL